MSNMSGYCIKCENFRTKYCDGDRETCMSILIEQIEKQQQYAKKIPQICNQNPCYFDIIKEPEGRDIGFVRKLAEKKCPEICPKFEK